MSDNTQPPKGWEGWVFEEECLIDAEEVARFENQFWTVYRLNELTRYVEVKGYDGLPLELYQLIMNCIMTWQFIKTLEDDGKETIQSSGGR